MAEFLSAFGIDWRLVIAQSINFIIVVAGLTYFLYRPILSIVDKRRALLEKGVRDANEAEQKLLTIENTKDGIIASAHKDAESIVSRAHEEGKKERASIVSSAQQRAETIVDDATKQGEEIKKKVLRDAEKEIAEVAILATERLIREKN